uniref:ZM domain-containing protein n=1 Tax=Heterorhabditis bacteriophora TaxID=37862 RepID=A0A1I7XQU9_HETBA
MKVGRVPLFLVFYVCGENVSFRSWYVGQNAWLLCCSSLYGELFSCLYQQNAYNSWVAAGGYVALRTFFRDKMEEVLVEGVHVPAAIAANFNRSRENTPFSYSRPVPGHKNKHSKIQVPKVLPLVKETDMAQPIHLQYNSPMHLYSKEAVEEQFQQQIGGGSPIPLPAPTGDKHFDPSKSATLRYIQIQLFAFNVEIIEEGDRGEFGEHFFEKVAVAEAPNVPSNQEIQSYFWNLAGHGTPGKRVNVHAHEPLQIQVSITLPVLHLHL